MSTATGGFVAFDDTPVGGGTLGQDGRIAFPAADAVGPPAVGRPDALAVYGLEGNDTFNVVAGTSRCSSTAAIRSACCRGTR